MSTAHQTGGTIAVYAGDCLQVMADLPEGSFDAVITDPPYGLEFMGQDWDAPWTSDPHVGRRWKTGIGPVAMAYGTWRVPLPSFDQDANTRCRTCDRWRVSSNPCRCAHPDFPHLHAVNMRVYQQWCTTWAAQCLRLLKPGGHLLAFGGTRTGHRLACGIEDAGFQIRDRIGVLAWIYATGFPKGRNLHGQWKGWGSGLKPAHEPIILARKPLAGTVAANVAEHGTGALHIDACRVPSTGTSRARGGEPSQRRRYRHRGGTSLAALPGVRGGDPAGRWPTNLVLIHHPDCTDPGPCAPGCPVAELDDQSGARRAGGAVTGTEPSRPFTTVYGQMTARRARQSYADHGGASRFYPCFRYQPKASRAERPTHHGTAHPTVKPLELMRWLVRLVTPPGGHVLDPFAGSGTTAEACLLEHVACTAIERNPDYLPLITARLHRYTAPPADTRGTS